jgi:formylglycine-generating enzyme required for sulfatase activity
VYYSNETLTDAYTKTNAANLNKVYIDCSKKGYRLPTEAEWEYAARYIDGTSWNHGNHVSGDTAYACYDEESCSHDLGSDARIGEYTWSSKNNSGSIGDVTYGTKAVGQKTANALGLRDMSGNVWEWCYEGLTSYVGGSVSDPIGSINYSDRVLRGGSWCYSELAHRCANRISIDSWERSYDFGIRLCRTAD